MFFDSMQQLNGEVPSIRSVNWNLVESVFEKVNGLEEAVFSRADHRFLQQAKADFPIKELRR